MMAAMNFNTWVALLLALFLGAACTALPEGDTNQAYTLVLIKTGPADGEVVGEERAKAFEGHFANMGRLAEARQLLVAGPYGKSRHDPMLRGIFVLNTAERAQAEAWASTDPTTERGVFVLEYHALETEAPLLQALERDLEHEARALAENRTLAPGDNARPYVLLTAEDSELAQQELAALVREQHVCLLAKLDGERLLAWLDATNVAAAQARFASALGRLGAHTLDDWFGSQEIEGLSHH